MSASGFVYLHDVTIVIVAEKAILIDLDGERLWIPKSQIAPDDVDGLDKGDGYSFGITEWIAKQKGIE